MTETSVGAREGEEEEGEEAEGEEAEAEADEVEVEEASPRTTSETETELPADGHSTDHGSETRALTAPPATTCADPGCTPWACSTAE